MRDEKGMVFGLPFLLLAGFIMIVSVAIFAIFFKVNITTIIVDVDSVNRYQEIPTAALGTVLFAESNSPPGSGGSDTRTRGEIHCFNGNGPAGAHGSNEALCTKHLAFYFSKFSSGVGQKVLYRDFKLGLPLNECTFGAEICHEIALVKFRKQILASLPSECYRYSFEYGDREDVLANILSRDRAGLAGADNCPDKNIDPKSNTFKLNELYPIPIVLGSGPAVASQRLFIGISAANPEGLLVTWPRYVTDFAFMEGDV